MFWVLICTVQMSFAKWLSVHLRTKWFWVQVQLQSLKLQISRLLRARSSLTFRQLQSVDSLWNAYVTWQEDTISINKNFLGCFRFIGNLIPPHSFSSRLNKKYVIWWWFAQNSIFTKNIVSVLKKVWSSTTHVEQVNEASYWLIYH